MRQLSPKERPLLGQIVTDFQITINRLRSAYAKKHQQIKPKEEFETEARQLVFNQHLGPKLSQDDFIFWSGQLRRELRELKHLAQDRLREGARQHEREIVNRLPDNEQQEYWTEKKR